MNIGDKILVNISQRKANLKGTIVGESRNGRCWIIKYEHLKTPKTCNKNFVTLQLS